ncbi:hypothetical protein NDU88_003939 [Pleurodeles waltl]|uniref:Uncharacterized protein n=1 Tax=Pleurodeles waltl TaxID=8319 RepID=A0AAV7TSQ0_PLEWA|nr:hypothetical protein NDU88_003939 [Pleurodeles waltl]
MSTLFALLFDLVIEPGAKNAKRKVKISLPHVAGPFPVPPRVRVAGLLVSISRETGRLAADGKDRGRAPPPHKAHPVGLLPFESAGAAATVADAPRGFCGRREARLRTPYSVLQTPAVPAAPGALRDVLTRMRMRMRDSGSGSEGGS